MTKAPLTTSNSTAMRVLAAASILMLVVAVVAGMAALGGVAGPGGLLVMALAAAAVVVHAGAVDDLRVWWARKVGSALQPLCAAAIRGLPPLSLSRTRPALRAADAAAPAAAAVGGLAPADARPPRLSL